MPTPEELLSTIMTTSSADRWRLQVLTKKEIKNAGGVFVSTPLENVDRDSVVREVQGIFGPGVKVGVLTGGFADLEGSEHVGFWRRFGMTMAGLGRTAITRIPK